MKQNFLASYFSYIPEKKLTKTFLYLLEITWLMFLDRGLYWFDYLNNVEVQSPVTLMPLGETIEPPLRDANKAK